MTTPTPDFELLHRLLAQHPNAKAAYEYRINKKNKEINMWKSKMTEVVHIYDETFGILRDAFQREDIIHRSAKRSRL